MFRLIIIGILLLNFQNGYSQVTGVVFYNRNVYLVNPVTQLEKIDSSEAVMGGFLDSTKSRCYYFRKFETEESITVELLRYTISSKKLDTLVQNMGVVEMWWLSKKLDVVAFQSYREAGYNSQDVFLLNMTTSEVKYLSSCFFDGFVEENGLVRIKQQSNDFANPGNSIVKEQQYDPHTLTLLRTIKTYSKLND